MRRFHKIPGNKRARTRRILRKWKYPRELNQHEIHRSMWFSFGPDCIVWLEPVFGERGAWILHLALNPKTQKRHGKSSVTLFSRLDAVADLHHMTRLIANDCTESGEVTDYLRRLGWTPCTMETIEGEWFEKRFTDEKKESNVEPPNPED